MAVVFFVDVDGSIRPERVRDVTSMPYLPRVGDFVDGENFGGYVASVNHELKLSLFDKEVCSQIIWVYLQSERI